MFWLKSSRRLSTFVANRVNEIKSYSDLSFHYIPSELNIADKATRGHPASLDANWFSGPPFLKLPFREYPVSSYEPINSDELQFAETEFRDNDMLLSFIENNNAELELIANDIVPTVDLSIISLTNFSSFRRLIRVTCMVLRAVRIFKGHRPVSSCISAEEMKDATHLWIQHVQREAYPNETALRQVSDLVPVKDEHGILRCIGRFKYLTSGHRRPILLPKSSHFSKLIVSTVHRDNFHLGVSQTLALVRQKYWIPACRAMVRRVISQCSVCRKYEGGHYIVPPLADLPSLRLTESRPFLATGTDFMGPVITKRKIDGKKFFLKKSWICLFTCFSTRAIHLEVVPDLTAESFLQCLRRFIARYNRPELILSDNFSSFKLANETIDIAFRHAIFNFCANQNIIWRYITALRPWSGGFYERLIALVKRSLRKTIGSTPLEEFQFLTLTAEIESMLNSRPLVYVDCDINSSIILTPGHFLNLQTFSSLPDIDTSDPEFQSGKKSSVDKLLQFWVKGQKLLQQFWHLWRTEYLAALREKNKILLKQSRKRYLDKPRVGDVVLIEDNSLPRGQWRAGKIIKLNYSSDNLVRSAQIKMSNNKIIDRSVKCLYPFETSSSLPDPLPSSGVTDNTSLEQTSSDPLLDGTRIPSSLSSSSASEQSTHSSSHKRPAAVKAREYIRSISHLL